MAVKPTNSAFKTLAVNRKARYLYHVEENLECGISLRGTEVKSMKSRQFSFTDAHAKIENGELMLLGLHITPYSHGGNVFNHDPDRPRTLLVHRGEIKKLRRKVIEKGLTMIPLRFYLKRGLVKLDLGLCRGKKAFDKRDTIKRRDEQRDSARELQKHY